jgi:anti-sigma regulatory factor (Ser/Thr protein kinase)
VATDAPLERLLRTFRLDDHQAPYEARLALTQLRGVDPRIAGDLRIVVSELVANAIRYAPRVPDGHVTVSVDRDDDGFYVEVRDPGAGFDPTPDPMREGGLGLLMVDRIAASWGIESNPGTTVWCRVPSAFGPHTGQP